MPHYRSVISDPSPLSTGGPSPVYHATRKYVLKSAPPVPGVDAPPLLVNVPYRPASAQIDSSVRPYVSIFKHGAKIHWKPRPTRAKSGGEGNTRGQIGDMSPKARRRAAFAFGNAPWAWQAMLTLTFREQHQNPKACLDRFTAALRKGMFMNCQWGWVMEYQSRGVAHYHLFFGADWWARNCPIRSTSIQLISRRGRETSIVRGPLDRWLVDQWIAAVADPSEDFRRFQEGGILELFRTPDAAARYVAKETGKACQKALPEGIEGGRRWWWLSDEGQPVREGYEILQAYPLERIFGSLYDKSVLAGCFAWKSPGEQMDIPF